MGQLYAGFYSAMTGRIFFFSFFRLTKRIKSSEFLPPQNIARNCSFSKEMVITCTSIKNPDCQLFYLESLKMAKNRVTKKISPNSPVFRFVFFDDVRLGFSFKFRYDVFFSSNLLDPKPSNVL